MNGLRIELLTLPNELLDEVASCIDSFQDLNSLTCTCHFFHALLKTILYHRAVVADDAVREVIMRRALSDIAHPVDSLARLLDNGMPLTLLVDSNCMLRYLCKLPNQERAVSVAKFLIERGADMEETKDSDTSETVLHTAAQEDKFEFASLLLAQGAKVNAVDRYGTIPLHFVCDNGQNAAMINLFCTHGADVNAYDKFGNTPLLMAQQWNYRVLFPALLAHGADVRAHNLRNRMTPLHWAALWFDEDDLELAKAMLARGASVNATSVRTPLHSAARFRRKTCVFLVNFFLEHGADVNAISYDGRSPLMEAVSNVSLERGEKAELVKLLIAHGADVSLLGTADREMVEMLLAGRP